MESVYSFRKGACGEESVTNYLEVTSSPLKLALLVKRKKKGQLSAHLLSAHCVYSSVLGTLGDVTEDKLCSSN